MEHKTMETVTGESELIQMFKSFDRDGNGLISAAELKETLAYHGEFRTDEQVDKMIRERGSDGHIN